MAKPSPDSNPRLRLLALEFWGLGDLALAMPFLRMAATHAEVTLVGKPHAGPLLARFAPGVRHIPLTAPWTPFTKKYRLLSWPWRELAAVRRTLRAARFDVGVSGRPDAREHLFLAVAGARRRLGFPRHGSSVFLTSPLPAPARRHRAEHWAALASTLGWPLPPSSGMRPPPPTSRRIVIHTGAGHPVRLWPRPHFEEIAQRLRAAGWDVQLLDDTHQDLDALLANLAGAERFVGNDSGPGHLAALLGVPTFTIFGPQLPELFAPQHPAAAWIEGEPCPYKPCFDSCRFPAPFCIRNVTVDAVWVRLRPWLEAPAPS